MVFSNHLCSAHLLSWARGIGDVCCRLCGKIMMNRTRLWILWSGKHLIWDPWKQKCMRWSWALSLSKRSNSTSSSNSLAWFLSLLRNELEQRIRSRSGKALSLVSRTNCFYNNCKLNFQNRAKCLSFMLSKHHISTIIITFIFPILRISPTICLPHRLDLWRP